MEVSGQLHASTVLPQEQEEDVKVANDALFISSFQKTDHLVSIISMSHSK